MLLEVVNNDSSTDKLPLMIKKVEILFLLLLVTNQKVKFSNVCLSRKSLSNTSDLGDMCFFLLNACFFSSYTCPDYLSHRFACFATELTQPEVYYYKATAAVLSETETGICSKMAINVSTWGNQPVSTYIYEIAKC